MSFWGDWKGGDVALLRICNEEGDESELAEFTGIKYWSVLPRPMSSAKMPPLANFGSAWTALD